MNLDQLKGRSPFLQPVEEGARAALPLDRPDLGRQGPRARTGRRVRARVLRHRGGHGRRPQGRRAHRRARPGRLLRRDRPDRDRTANRDRRRNAADGADRHVPARVQADGAGDAGRRRPRSAQPFAPDSTRASSTCPSSSTLPSHEPLTARPLGRSSCAGGDRSGRRRGGGRIRRDTRYGPPTRSTRRTARSRRSPRSTSAPRA